MRNFKTVACTVRKLYYMSKSLTNERTDERPRSWGHKNGFAQNLEQIVKGVNA